MKQKVKRMLSWVTEVTGDQMHKWRVQEKERVKERVTGGTQDHKLKGRGLLYVAFQPSQTGARLSLLLVVVLKGHCILGTPNTVST